MIAIGLTVMFYASYTSTALLLLRLVINDPTPSQQTATVVVAAIFGGLARFTLLRTWVFRRRSTS